MGDGGRVGGMGAGGGGAVRRLVRAGGMVMVRMMTMGGAGDAGDSATIQATNGQGGGGWCDGAMVMVTMRGDDG